MEVKIRLDRSSPSKWKTLDFQHVPSIEVGASEDANALNDLISVHYHLLL